MLLELVNDEATPTAQNRPSETEIIAAYRTELDNYYMNMRHFNNWDISEVLRGLAGMSARAAALRSQIVRSESRRLTAFRTKELDPFLEQCEFQFKVFSRLHSVSQMDWEISRGGV